MGKDIPEISKKERSEKQPVDLTTRNHFSDNYFSV